MFKLVNPKHEHRTEHQSGRLSQSYILLLLLFCMLCCQFRVSGGYTYSVKMHQKILILGSSIYAFRIQNYSRNTFWLYSYPSRVFLYFLWSFCKYFFWVLPYTPIFSLLRYWYSILIWIFDWIDSTERRWMKMNDHMNETDVLYKNRNIKK